LAALNHDFHEGGTGVSPVNRAFADRRDAGPPLLGWKLVIC